MGYVSKNAYDAADRVVKAMDKKGQVATYTYKPNTNYVAAMSKGNTLTQYTYDDFGNVLTATNDGGTYTYVYKFNNLLESITAPDGKQITYGYNANKMVNSVVDYSGTTIGYTYNGVNKVDKITRNGVLVADYDYYNFGALQKITYQDIANVQYTYDNALQLTALESRLTNGRPIVDDEYTYDLNGNMVERIDDINIVNTSYSYDDVGRLTAVSGIGDQYSTYAYTYTFDNFDNMTSKTITHTSNYGFTYSQSGQDYTMNNVSAHQFSYTYDNNNRLISGTENISGITGGQATALQITTANQYDNNGNLVKTTKGGQIDETEVEYTYNPLNQLTGYTDENEITTSYGYAPDGMIHSMTHNNVQIKYYWDRGYMSAESQNGSITAQYFIGPDGIFVRQTSAGTEYMYKNGHGDIMELVDGFDTTEKYDYDAYGAEKNPNPAHTNPFRYAGEYQDPYSGLVYLRNRYYDASIGRFVSEDTHWNPSNMIYGDKEYNVGEIKIPDMNAIVQSSNLYAYCMNNPMNFVDPSGDSAIAGVILALYGYAQAVITSPDLQYDMQVFAYDISQGDYTSAAFDVVDILAPGISGSKMAPKFIRKYFDDVVGMFRSPGVRAVSNLSTERISHIINGSKGKDHLWRNVTDNVNWNNIKTFISDTIDNGNVISEKIYTKNNVTTKVYTAIKNYNGNIVEVKYNMINGVAEVSDAWVRP